MFHPLSMFAASGSPEEASFARRLSGKIQMIATHMETGLNPGARNLDFALAAALQHTLDSILGFCRAELGSPIPALTPFGTEKLPDISIAQIQAQIDEKVWHTEMPDAESEYQFMERTWDRIVADLAGRVNEDSEEA